MGKFVINTYIHTNNKKCDTYIFKIAQIFMCLLTFSFVNFSLSSKVDMRVILF